MNSSNLSRERKLFMVLLILYSPHDEHSGLRPMRAFAGIINGLGQNVGARRAFRGRVRRAANSRHLSRLRGVRRVTNSLASLAGTFGGRLAGVDDGRGRPGGRLQRAAAGEPPPGLGEPPP